MKKDTFLCVIISVMALFCMPNKAMAYYTFVVDGITYEADDVKVSVEAVPNMEDVVIPGSVIYNGKKYTVTKVDDNAFSDCKNLVSLTLPPTLKSFWGKLTECHSLRRINISSMFDFMELSTISGRLFERSGVGLYLNGELVTHVDITNAEPKDALCGYKMLKSVTFCSSEKTTIKEDILKGCSLDTLCFKSPSTILTSSIEFPAVENLFFIGDLGTEDATGGKFKAKYAYIKGSFSSYYSYYDYNHTVSADVCIIDSKSYSAPYLYVDTCVITPSCPNNGDFCGRKNSFNGCKNIVFLSPNIRPNVPSSNQTYFVLDKDSATVEWTTYNKQNDKNNMKLICGMKKPLVNKFEYYGQSPLESIDINDSTDVVQTTLDTDRLKKDVGDYTEIPVSFSVHGMIFDTSLPYKYSITKAPLTILAKSDKREYGEENPELSCTYIGFKNGEDESVLEAKPALYTTALKESPVGSYPIIPANAKSMNYSMNYQNGVLTIEPASQEITWEQELTKAKVGDIIELHATSSANLKVKFRSSNTAIADVYTSKGKTFVEFLAAGAVRITAYQPGDNNHSEADDVIKRLIVEDESTDISTIDSEKNKVIGYYTMDGRLIETPQKGIYIVKYANGHMRKTVVK